MVNDYTHAANELTQELRRFSPSAADCVEQIRFDYGIRAAYLAAFALIIYRERLTRSGKASDREDLKRFIYYQEMRDIADAIELYEAAAGYVLPETNQRNSLARR
jgi:hypothetical protein